MTSFAQYIESLDGGKGLRDSVRRDFIEDTAMLIELGKFPAIETWTDLHWFLLCRDACDEALAAGRREWRRFEQWRRTQLVAA